MMRGFSISLPACSAYAHALQAGELRILRMYEISKKRKKALFKENKKYFYPVM